MEKIRILENGMQSEKSARVKLEAHGSMVPCRRTVLHEFLFLQNITSQLQEFATWLQSELDTNSTVRLSDYSLANSIE